MSAGTKRISIVVATKDRYETLFDCVRGLLINYGGNDCEIVVRDNSARPRADEFMAAFGAHRSVVYRADPMPVSQSDNYERAVAMATGDYVTMIGDDDGVAFGLLQIAGWMDRHGIEAFFPGFSVYLWPGVSARFAAPNEDGRLSFGPQTYPRLVDAHAQRKAVLASGSTSLEELPRLYYGLVRRTCLDRVRADAGSFFPGPSPDMANAFALSYVVGKLAVAELPVFIAGNSRKSAAGMGLRGHHVGEIPSLPFLPRDTTEMWNPGIPYFWSGQTIWCQSAFTAAAAMGRAAEFEGENAYRRLYARALVFQPGFAMRTVRALRARHPGLGRQGVELAATSAIAAAMWFSRISGFVRRRLRARSGPLANATQVHGLPSVIDATRHVDGVMHASDLGPWLDRSMQTVAR